MARFPAIVPLVKDPQAGVKMEGLGIVDRPWFMPLRSS